MNILQPTHFYHIERSGNEEGSRLSYTKSKYKIVCYIFPHPSPLQSSKDWIILYFHLVLELTIRLFYNLKRYNL
jgi:hypothetical protein